MQKSVAQPFVKENAGLKEMKKNSLASAKKKCRRRRRRRLIKNTFLVIDTFWWQSTAVNKVDSWLQSRG